MPPKECYRQCRIEHLSNPNSCIAKMVFFFSAQELEYPTSMKTEKEPVHLSYWHYCTTKEGTIALQKNPNSNTGLEWVREIILNQNKNQIIKKTHNKLYPNLLGKDCIGIPFSSGNRGWEKE